MKRAEPVISACILVVMFVVGWWFWLWRPVRDVLPCAFDRERSALCGSDSGGDVPRPPR